MNKLVKNFNLKSKRVSSKPLYKYCNLEESEINGKKVVWSLENLKNNKLYFSRFIDFKDFNELKMGFRLQNGVEFYIDEAMSGDVDEHLDNLEQDEINILKDIFKDVDNPEDVDLETFKRFLKTDVYKRLVEDTISQSEHLSKVPNLNYETLINVIENTSELYMNENTENTNLAIDYQSWSKNKLDEEVNKIDMSQLNLDNLKTKLKEFKDIINERYVCTCLSTSYDNFNNWQVFSQGRNGFVIEYDFSNEKVEFQSTYTFLKVKYSKTPVMTDLVMMNRIQKNPKDIRSAVELLEYLANVIKTKNDSFKSENEVRIVANRKKLEEINYLMDVSNHIKAVYVYKDNESDYLDVLINICKEKEIDLYWLDDSIDSYEIRLSKMD